ncbi:hypothetical protein NP233_g10756 [Leucocoprinus birnbaumii]|uniref:RNase H type-1 domain-containing protein n=1 Tax=Leucocoprinus birnbaumii TaxID=56174 RepID=A0AAD5VNQ0_9AGAR|nr:hypothetical protein NP233_g10756 [Leucocoprinus birnbaumii]
MAQRINNQDHIDATRCECPDCTFDRTELDCNHPNICASVANDLLNKLEAVWDPRCFNDTERNNTAPDENQNTKDGNQDSNEITWTDNPPPRSIEDALRIMPTNQLLPDQILLEEANQHQMEDNMEIEIDASTPPREIYIAGACTRPGTEEAKAGSRVILGSNTGKIKISARVPGPQTPLSAELFALKTALDISNKYEPIRIWTRSSQLIRIITQDFKGWEDKGWVEVPHKNLIKTIITHLRNRKATSLFHFVKRKDKTYEQTEAGLLAREGRDKPQTDQEGASLQKPYHPNGAKLQAVTQASVYRHLIETRNQTESQTSKDNIEIIKRDIKEVHNSTPTTALIWHSLKRNKDTLRKHKDFIYKAIKGTHYIGKKWIHSNNEEMRARAQCRTCNEIESLDHILCHCRAPGQARVWNTAKNIWEAKYGPWNKPKLGEILGITSISFQDEKGQKDPSKTQLYHILITECTHLIWRLRCERVIQHEDNPQKWHTENGINRLLKSRLNHRLKMDCILTNTRKFDAKAIREGIVRETWEGLLEDEENLPDHWPTTPGVLVGSRFFE